MFNYERFGQRIAELRKERNWRIQDLSCQSGVSITIISQLENNQNKNITMRTIYKLAKAFDISVQDLIIECEEG